MSINSTSINQKAINEMGVPSPIIITPGIAAVSTLASSTAVQESMILDPEPGLSLIAGSDPITIMSSIQIEPGVGDVLSDGSLQVILESISLEDFIGSATTAGVAPVVIQDSLELTPTLGEAFSSSTDPNLFFSSFTFVPGVGEATSSGSVFPIQTSLEFTEIGVTDSSATIDEVVLGTIILFPVGESVTEGSVGELEFSSLEVVPDFGTVLSFGTLQSPILGSVQYTPEFASASTFSSLFPIQTDLLISGLSTEVQTSAELKGLDLTSVTVDGLITEVNARAVLDSINVLQESLVFTESAEVTSSSIFQTELSSIYLTLNAEQHSSAVLGEVEQSSLSIIPGFGFSTTFGSSSVSLGTIFFTDFGPVVSSGVDPGIELSSLTVVPGFGGVQSLADAIFVFSSIDLVPTFGSVEVDAEVKSVLQSSIFITDTVNVDGTGFDPEVSMGSINLVPPIGDIFVEANINPYYKDYDWMTLTPRELYQVVPTGKVRPQFSSYKYVWEKATSSEYVYYLTQELLELQAKGYILINTVLDLQYKSSDQIGDNTGGTVLTDGSSVTPIADFDYLNDLVATIIEVHTEIRDLLIELSSVFIEYREELAYIQSNLNEVTNDILDIQVTQ